MNVSDDKVPNPVIVSLALPLKAFGAIGLLAKKPVVVRVLTVNNVAHLVKKLLCSLLLDFWLSICGRALALLWKTFLLHTLHDYVFLRVGHP